MANTRYNFTELVNAQAVGIFETGKTVTIEVYDARTGLAETLTTNACTEIGTTGVFVWEFSNLDTLPSAFTQFLYIMTDNSTTPVKRRELLDTGGWVESLPSALPPADTCKITTSLSDGDGQCFVTVEDLFDTSMQNYIELPQGTSVFANSRYFKVGKYQPSYDRVTGAAYWILPQGASANVKLTSFGIDESNKTIPAQSTIDLNTWLTT